MVVKKESIEQTSGGAWAASSTVNVDLDRIGLATRYETVFEQTTSATALGANQPDALWRPFRNVQFLAGGHTYFTLPDEAGGHGGTLQHYLNLRDGFGRRHVHQLVAAPSQAFYIPSLVWHPGVFPRRKDGTDNPFDLSAFLPAGIESSPQITWTTTAGTVMDDTITLDSGTLRVKAHRVLGTTEDIEQEMVNQGVMAIIDMIRRGDGGLIAEPTARGLIPSWYAQVEAPTAVAANYGSELDAQLGGFLTRFSMLVQDAIAIRPNRADDEVTALQLSIPEKGMVILRSRLHYQAGDSPPGDFLVAAEGLGIGVNAGPGGIYAQDMRPYGPTTLEQVLGLDTRGRQSGYAKWGRTITTNASGDDILSLTERLLVYHGRVSNA